jgi:transposase-like protein
MAISVKGAHFLQDLMRMGVRWSLTSPLRYRHREARMAECGVRLDHATIGRGSHCG